MGKSDYDMDIKEMLQEEIEIPKAVDESFEQAYGKIRRGEVQMKRLNNGKRRRIYQKAGVAAAAACMVIALTGVLYVNPALAKDIPILGDVFGKIQQMRDSSPYPDKDKTAYDKIAEHSSPVNDPTNVAEDQGISMEISDAYCDGHELYFTLSLKTDDEEMNKSDWIELMAYREGSSEPNIAWLTVSGEEVYPTSAMSLQKADDQAYVTLVRVEAMNMPKGTFPEDMDVALNIGAASGYQDSDVPTAEFKTIKGSWKLAFHPQIDTSNNRTTELQAEKDGFVVKEITKTPSNTYVTLVVPADWAAKNPADVLKDTAGNRIYEESARIVEQEDGSWIKYMVFDQTDADQFILQMYDKNAELAENEPVPLIVEIPFSME